MTEDFLPHIFEEFSRERTTTESRIIGTGLGMPIVKRLVELMEGTIKAESKVGVGTRITIALPHRLVDEPDKSVSKEEEENYRKDFSGKRILLAEDNDLNAEIAIVILEDAGFMVDRADDGIVAVDMMEKAEPGYYDIILMDIQMPNLNGYGATRIIRNLSDKKKASIPIVAMTANAFDEDKRDAMKAGMDGHISKPLDVQKLFDVLDGLLRRQ